jgi:hypothetical protein
MVSAVKIYWARLFVVARLYCVFFEPDRYVEHAALRFSTTANKLVSAFRPSGAATCFTASKRASIFVIVS